MTTKNFGAGASPYLDVDGRSFETTVFQASKPVLDSELNQGQDIEQARTRSVLQLAQSGWLGADVLTTTSHSAGLFIASATNNELRLPPMKALVNGWLINVENTGVVTNNAVGLGTAPSGAGALRTDLVVLEVWRRLLSASPSTVGKSASGRIWRHGNVKVASGDDVSLNFADDILNANVGAESTKRVQIQYRLRVVQGVNLDSYPFGISDPTVVAFSTPTSAAAPDGSATLFAYASQSNAGDGGLWRAGDGDPANTIGSVDGYIYALPLVAVFRRNTTAFTRDTNHNGGSGRPDTLTATIIDARDVMDLRLSVSTTGWNLLELLQKNLNLVLDNQLRTEQSTTPLGGGSKGHSNIWADEIGPIDNAGAQKIRAGFDGVCRRFSDRPVLEQVVVRYVPADQDGGGSTWSDISVLTIDPTGGAKPFRIYPHGSANFINAAPANVAILDVLSVVCMDPAEGPIPILYQQPGETDLSRNPYQWVIEGLGGNGPITLTLGLDLLNTNGDLYVTLLVSYPGGAEPTAGGLTKTPTRDFGAASIVLESPAQLPAAAPYLYQSTVASFDAAHREVALSYQTLTTTFTQACQYGGINLWENLPSDTFPLFVPDRVSATPSPTVTNITTGANYTGVVQRGSDGHVLVVSATAGSWSPAGAPSQSHQMRVTYQASRPLPNNGVQVTLWYETRAPQTTRTSLLGTSLTVIPRYVSPYMLTLAAGTGSLDEAYPFPQQCVQSPGVYPSSAGSFGGDHELDGAGAISISDFNAQTGFLQVPVMIPAVPDPQSLTFIRNGGDIDAEGRSYFKEVPAGYIPSAFAQPLSESKRHKNILPMVAELATDGPMGPRGTLLMVLLSRWARFDPTNFVGFDPDLSMNFTSASVYRLKGNPLNSRRV